eukprot:GHVL01004692.1.p1 GENE.GHVL01004692.1~~GHVL01004692.1.p1  ORF type:complete len:613 (+),score=134.72 GHVL01004692.1:459-2297(+)
MTQKMNGKSPFQVSVSCYEIFGNTLSDLLPPCDVWWPQYNSPKSAPKVNMRACFLKTHKFCYQDIEVRCAVECLDLLDEACLVRKSGESCSNVRSSRSHAVVQLSIRLPITSHDLMTQGALTLVDLAGSEKEHENPTASGRTEARILNSSLSELTKLLRKLQKNNLTESDRRQGVLNRLLFSVLQPDCGITMIFCVNPENSRPVINASSSTLSMATDCKMINNRREKQFVSIDGRIFSGQSVKNEETIKTGLPPRSPMQLKQIIEDSSILSNYTETLRDSFDVKFCDMQKQIESLNEALRRSQENTQNNSRMSDEETTSSSTQKLTARNPLNISQVEGTSSMSSMQLGAVECFGQIYHRYESLSQEFQNYRRRSRRHRKMLQRQLRKAKDRICILNEAVSNAQLKRRSRKENIGVEVYKSTRPDDDIHRVSNLDDILSSDCCYNSESFSELSISDDENININNNTVNRNDIINDSVNRSYLADSCATIPDLEVAEAASAVERGLLVMQQHFKSSDPEVQQTASEWSIAFDSLQQNLSLLKQLQNSPNNKINSKLTRKQSYSKLSTPSAPRHGVSSVDTKISHRESSNDWTNNESPLLSISISSTESVLSDEN